MDYKVPLILTPQAEGGYTVTDNKRRRCSR